jgi:hypothetical protein
MSTDATESTPAVLDSIGRDCAPPGCSSTHASVIVDLITLSGKVLFNSLTGNDLLMSHAGRSPSKPVSLNRRADENLRYIRDVMEGANVFTGVSGMGYVYAGFTALVAAWLAARQSSEAAWLLVWMVELVLAATIAFCLMFRKTTRQGKSLFNAGARKLLLAFIPAMSVGGLLTWSYYLQDIVALLPGIWLGLYGAAVLTAGAWSVRAVPVMGVLFVVLAALVLLTSVSSDVMLALGFGGLHIIFGAWIWRHHGG